MDEVFLLDGGVGYIYKKRYRKGIEDRAIEYTLCQQNESGVDKIHKEFAAAGSDILFSHTYHYFNTYGVWLQPMTAEMMSRNIQILTEYCAERRISNFCVSCGPLAVKFYDCSEYSGAYMRDGRATKKDVFDHYTFLMSMITMVMNPAKPPMLAFETIPSKLEVEALMDALVNFPHFKYFISVVPQDADTTVFGDSLTEIAELVTYKLPRLQAFGINCFDPRLCLTICKKLSQVVKPDTLLLVKPNDGRTFNEKKKKYEGEIYDMTPDLVELVECNVRYIGGCCTVYPDTIKKYAKFMGQYNRRTSRENLENKVLVGMEINETIAGLFRTRYPGQEDEVNLQFWKGEYLTKDADLVEEAHEDMAKSGCHILSSATYPLWLSGDPEQNDHVSNLFAKNFKILDKICAKYGSSYSVTIGPQSVSFQNADEELGGLRRDLILQHYDSMLGLVHEFDKRLVSFEGVQTLKEACIIVQLLPKYPQIKALVFIRAALLDEPTPGKTYKEVALLLARCDQVLAFGMYDYVITDIERKKAIMAPAEAYKHRVLIKPGFIMQDDSFVDRTSTPELARTRQQVSVYSMDKVKYIACLTPEEVAFHKASIAEDLQLYV